MIEFFLKLFSLSHFISICATQIIFGILFLFFINEIRKKNIVFEWENIYLLFFLYFIWIDISLIANFNSFPTILKFLKSLIKWWHYAIFIVIYILCKYLKVNFILIFNYLLIGASASSLVGIYQRIVDLSFGKGLYSHALTYSNNILMLLIVLYSLLLTKKIKFSKYYVILGILNFFGLIASLERGPLLYLIITILFLNFIIFKKKGLVINIFIILITVATIFFYKPLQVRFKTMFDKKYLNNPNKSGVTTRIILWKASLKIIKKKPFFGVGRKLKKELSEIVGDKLKTKSHSHNSYLSIACYHGIPAIIILIFIYLYLLNVFWQSNYLFAKTAGIGVIVIYLLEGLTEYNFGDAEVTMLFWFLMGLLYYESKLILHKQYFYDSKI